MKIKRTVAEDMRAAMQIIRDTHGPDAVILSKRTVAGGIEVVSAIDVDAEDTVAPEQRPSRRAESRPPRARRGTVAELEHEISAATTAEQAGANRTVARAAQLLESAKAARRALTPSASTQAVAAKAEINATQTPTFEQRLAQANADLKAQPRASNTTADLAPADHSAATDVDLPTRSTPAPELHQPEQRPSVAASKSLPPDTTRERARYVRTSRPASGGIFNWGSVFGTGLSPSARPRLALGSRGSKPRALLLDQRAAT